MNDGMHETPLTAASDESSKVLSRRRFLKLSGTASLAAAALAGTGCEMLWDMIPDGPLPGPGEDSGGNGGTDEGQVHSEGIAQSVELGHECDCLGCVRVRRNSSWHVPDARGQFWDHQREQYECQRAGERAALSSLA